MRLSLRSKLAYGFSLLLILIAVLGWVTLSLFGSLRAVQRSILEQAVPELVAVDEVVRSYTAQSAAVRGYLIGSEPALLTQFRTEVTIAREWEERAGERFAGREKRRLDRLVQTGHAFQELVDRRVLPLAQQGLRSQAFRVLSQEGTNRIMRVERLGQKLRASQIRLVQASEADLSTRSNQAVVLLSAVIVSALLIGAFVAFALPRRLSRNLSRLVEAARSIGRGDLDQHVDIHSGDEVEELAVRFREMQAGLKRLQQLALQDQELDIAASIQRRLLQGSVPQISGLTVTPLQRQANLVGGDWYDVEASTEEVSIAVGDASGKGIGAALMATVALSFLRAEHSLGASGRRVIERVNDALIGATEPDSFTTLVYVVVDVKTGVARWLNMGHPSPFILTTRGDSSTPRGYYLEGLRNRALGWFEEPGLQETVVNLAAGDRLILFTDGWLEAKSPEGEMFGERRLGEALIRLATLEASAIGEQLVEEVERFAAGKLDDDLTMLVVEFAGAPGRTGVAQ